MDIQRLYLLGYRYLWNNKNTMLRCDQQTQVIDSDGFRLNVGIILSNREGKLFWARRIGQNAWQFPQGGIHHDETPEEALYRELMEEIGLSENHVDIIGCTKNWLRYRLPKRLIRRKSAPLCIGQKQIWYMLRFVGNEGDVCLNVSEKPEFDYWRWVNYWHPLKEVVFFKRKVYESALHELAPLLFSEFQGVVRAEIPPKPAVNQRLCRHDSKKTKP